ncbi:MAG: toll/interleukin-1 receptor domain-containing protein, partial [Chloroflexota bacterium]|nr:toll/interleukin-1 receptor domain-containing protein [Chloroflexota bacterium]
MPVNIFFCYAPQDRILLEELEKQLTYLQRQGIINIWHDLKISGGSKREQEINTHFSTAQIILLLVSPDFMRSDHCYTETIQALERQEAGEARVVPVILRNVTWENAPFAKLQALPADKRPIKSWQPKARQDKAFQEVAEGISKVVGEITSKDMQTTSLNTNLKPSISERKNTRERWLKEAANHEKIHNWTEALVAYEQLLLLDPENARIYYKKGSILSDLKRYEEALVAFKQVIQLDSKVTIVYQKIGDILKALRRYEEALVAYEHFIHYSPGDDDSFASEEAEACISKADMLYNMKRYEEALVAYNEAIEFYPDPLYFCFKADMLYNMKRYEEALVAYD